MLRQDSPATKRRLKSSRSLAWLADEQTLRDMQRREEVNINHSHRHDEQDDVEIGGNF